MYSCNTEDETLTHYLLRCPNHTQQRVHLMNELNRISPNLLFKNDNVLSSILLYGVNNISNEMNSKIIHSTIEYIHSSKRFDMLFNYLLLFFSLLKHLKFTNIS